MSSLAIPRHVAIIMDGNGRWAQKKLFPRTRGHRAGLKALRIAIESAVEFGVERLTVFAFGRENWQRPKEEVDELMLLFAEALVSEAQELCQKDVRLVVIGDRTRLSADVVNKILEAECLTLSGSRMTLAVAIDYSGQWELAQLCSHVSQRLTGKDLSGFDEYSLDHFAQELGMFPVDLLIRTSGEYRISNFMLWQCAYAELYFTSTLWPDFDRGEFIRALEDYGIRQRRFGKISEQISK